MLSILGNAVLPVFIMAGVGAVLGRTLHIDARSVGRMTLYVFSPALVFASLYDAEIPTRDVVNVFAFQAVWGVIFYASCFLIAWRAGLKGQDRSAFLLSTMFMNAANYGLPVALFAFGEAGLERAILFFAPQSLMAGTLAIYVASSGKLGAKQGLITVLRLPIFYAAVAGLVLNPFKVTLPGVLEIPLDILAAAAIPCMVMVLGIQLARASWKEDLVPAGAASVVRLLLSPLLAFGVTLLLGIDGVTQQTMVVIAGMPTAVYTTILATEFDARPQRVTSAVALSTAVSLVTMTTLIWLVQGFL